MKNCCSDTPAPSETDVAAASAPAVACVLPAHDLLVEPEKVDEESLGEEEDDIMRCNVDASTEPQQKDGDGEESGADMCGMPTQAELDEAAGLHSTDAVTRKFMCRMQLGNGDLQGQVLRYIRWDPSGNGILWVSSKGRLRTSPPPCEICGSERLFEFQVMPQLIHAVPLRQEECFSGSGLDWGILAVYTCTKSCSVAEPGRGCYMKEFVWWQPPLGDGDNFTPFTANAK